MADITVSSAVDTFMQAANAGAMRSAVGLGNVDNTSDFTKNAASATLTNKTLTAPVISTISNTGTVTLPTATDTLVGRATTDTLTNKTIAGGSNTISGITEAMLSTADNTTLDVSTSKHGFAPKAPNDATKYLDGTGAYTTPAGAGGGTWGSITGTLSSQTDLNSALALKATLASPTLTGTPAAPTASVGTSTTQLATTAFVLANAGSPQQDKFVGDGSTAVFTLTNPPAGAVANVEVNGLGAEPTVDYTLSGTGNKTLTFQIGHVPSAPPAGQTNNIVVNYGLSGAGGGGSGTVTSIVAGTGLSGGTITTSGTIAIDSTVATLTGSQTLTNKTLTSPTMTAPALGTPASGALTNCTAVPAAQVVGVIPIANLATGTPNGSKFIRDDGTLQAISGGGDALVANPLSQFAATTSLQLKGVISDETGSGALAFATSPTFVTPVMGVATATSINKVAITAPATSATITVADGKTLTASNSITIAGTDSTVMTFPATSATIARTDAANTFTGTQTFTAPVLGTPASVNLSNATVDGTNLVGYRGAPQNSQSTAYTTALGDAGKCIFHPVGDNNARTFTIDSNANVAYVIGTIIEFINMAAASVTIVITSDTMTLLPAGTTGSRTLAQYGRASAEKITSTSWIISGNSALT